MVFLNEKKMHTILNGLLPIGEIRWKHAVSWKNNLMFRQNGRYEKLTQKKQFKKRLAIYSIPLVMCVVFIMVREHFSVSSRF